MECRLQPGAILGRTRDIARSAGTRTAHPSRRNGYRSRHTRRRVDGNSAYVDLFTAAFGDDAVTVDNVERALAAFQRSLVSNDSPFDRYAAGEFDALTQQQRRGLGLFRSGATRCFECHSNPTFALDTFRIIGVDSDDPGRAGVADDGAFGAFNVPHCATLR